MRGTDTSRAQGRHSLDASTCVLPPTLHIEPEEAAHFVISRPSLLDSEVASPVEVGASEECGIACS